MLKGMKSIPKGTPVVIKAQGLTVRGEVISAEHYGSGDGWYIELGNANVPGGYSYWKQGQDGGELVEVDGIPTWMDPTDALIGNPDARK